MYKRQGEDEGTCSHLGKLYYRVREGLGFNKTPSEYGAFPADPYSHTPKHAGAQQPGMTGQVKEEILARFGELGIRVKAGTVQFQTNLLRPCEFVKEVTPFTYLDVDDNWQEITVPESGLAFTWCQVPIVYQVSDREESTLTITWEDGRQQILNQLTLPEKESSNLFLRNGHIRQISLNLNSTQLFSE